MFQALERIFHDLEHTFQALEYKIPFHQTTTLVLW